MPAPPSAGDVVLRLEGRRDEFLELVGESLELLQFSSCKATVPPDCNRTVKVREHMAAGRMTAALGAFAVIEMAAGEAGRHAVKAGEYLEVTV